MDDHVHQGHFTEYMDDATLTCFRSYVGSPHAALMTPRHYAPHNSRGAVAVGISISGHHVQISTSPTPLGDLHK